MTELPTYDEYKTQIDSMVSRAQLTEDQGIILMLSFKATLESTPVHINHLMSITGLNWKSINWVLNGLVMKKAIRKIETKYYMV